MAVAEAHFFRNLGDGFVGVDQHEAGRVHLRLEYILLQRDAAYLREAMGNIFLIVAECGSNLANLDIPRNINLDIVHDIKIDLFLVFRKIFHRKCQRQLTKQFRHDAGRHGIERHGRIVVSDDILQLFHQYHNLFGFGNASGLWKGKIIVRGGVKRYLA